MITKSEWRSINESLNSEERARLEPPAFDEVLQYMRGELPAEDEERMRERLVPFPELVRALTAQFPTEGAKPGDPDYVSDDEFAKQWAFLKHRAKRKSASQFWPAIGSVAAALAIVFGGLFWRAQTQLQIERTMPRVAGFPAPLSPAVGSNAAYIFASRLTHRPERHDRYRPRPDAEHYRNVNSW